MADLLFYGGPIVTVDERYPNAEAVVVANGRVSFVGTRSDAESAVTNASRRIDLAGQTLLPGFIDAHCHPLWAAKTRGSPVVDIRAETVPTYQAILGKIERRVAAAKLGEPLLFFGLDAQLHPDMEVPTRPLLDEMAPANPLGIQSSNCHALYLNSAGLELCGIDEQTPIPNGSFVERDRNGRLSGKLTEAITWQALESFYRAFGEARLEQEFAATLFEFASNGITTTTEHLYLPYYKAFYLSALNSGWPLPRIAAYQQATSADMQIEKFNIGDDRLWMAGVKIHADGSPFIGNIWLTEPYLENDVTLHKMDLRPGHTGRMNYSQAYFESMLRSYFYQGWQMSIHTQGDRTIDMVLDLLEKLLQERPLVDHRLRLEHCALMRQDQIIRAIEMGVLSSFFINHITHWGVPIEDVLFGPQRAAHYMPAGTALRKGMRISLHADTPMTDPSALALMQAARTRKTTGGRQLGADECLDAGSALRAVTIDAAFQIGKENALGSITPGKHADLIVLDRNPLETAAENLDGIRVMQTYSGGVKVWQHDG